MGYPKKVPHWLDHDKTPLTNAFTLQCPLTGEELAQVSSTTVVDINKAVQRATVTLPLWKQKAKGLMPDITHKLVKYLQSNPSNLLDILNTESGLPTEYFNTQLNQLTKVLSPESQESSTIAGQSNLPFIILGGPSKYLKKEIEQIVHTIAAGYSVIYHANPNTPYWSIVFAKQLRECGLPAGVFTVLQGPESLDEALINLPNINVLNLPTSVELA